MSNYTDNTSKIANKQVLLVGGSNPPATTSLFINLP